jgi:hypothetical protein
MSESKKERRVIRKRSPHHRVVHANQIGLTVTGTDVRLRFGCIEEATVDEMTVEDQVDVFLGPMEFHALHQLLGRNLSRFQIQKAPESKPETTPSGQAEQQES